MPWQRFSDNSHGKRDTLGDWNVLGGCRFPCPLPICDVTGLQEGEEGQGLRTPKVSPASAASCLCDPEQTPGSLGLSFPVSQGKETSTLTLASRRPRHEEERAPSPCRIPPSLPRSLPFQGGQCCFYPEKLNLIF